jgi:hypothetical protein
MLYGPISVVKNEMEVIKLANDYPLSPFVAFRGAAEIDSAISKIENPVAIM